MVKNQHRLHSAAVNKEMLNLMSSQVGTRKQVQSKSVKDERPDSSCSFPVLNNLSLTLMLLEVSKNLLNVPLVFGQTEYQADSICFVVQGLYKSWEKRPSKELDSHYNAVIKGSGLILACLETFFK